MRSRARRASILSDLNQQGPNPFGSAAPESNVASGVSAVDTSGLGPGAVGDLARSVIQIPFDDSIDSTHPLECFFQMPAGVVRVKSVQVWVQQKSFRQYVSAASSGGGTATSANGGAHYHSLGGNPTGTSGDATGDSTAASTTTDAQGVHNHAEHDGFVTSSDGNHSHNVGSHSHGHSHSHSHTYYYVGGNTGGALDHQHSIDTSHNHTLTPGIYETAASGTLSLYVANDGISYGAAKITGATAIPTSGTTGFELTPDITNAAGDKRIRINGTGLCRVQVLVVMDLILQLGA